MSPLVFWTVLPLSILVGVMILGALVNFLMGKSSMQDEADAFAKFDRDRDLK